MVNNHVLSSFCNNHGQYWLCEQPQLRSVLVHVSGETDQQTKLALGRRPPAHTHPDPRCWRFESRPLRDWLSLSNQWCVPPGRCWQVWKCERSNSSSWRTMWRFVGSSAVPPPPKVVRPVGDSCIVDGRSPLTRVSIRTVDFGLSSLCFISVGTRFLQSKLVT